MPPAYTLDALGRLLVGEVRGDPGVTLTGVASLAQAGVLHLSFVVNTRHLAEARSSRAGALVVNAELADALPGRACLVVDRPHACFARAVDLFHPEETPEPGVHPTAVVHPEATLGEGVVVSAHAIIDAGARIGPRTRVGPGCWVGPRVTIGADGRLYARVSIYADCQLGDRVRLHSGCVIGSDGFGLAWEGDHWRKVAQVGRVVVGDDVEIGSNTTVDRGALDDTVIGNGVKLDNLIQVAHNVRIGDHTAIAGCVGIAGSTRIGARCQIGGAAMFSGHIDIADGTVVSAGTFVGKDLHRPDTYTSVMPLMPHADWKRNASHIRHLDALRERLRRLERERQSNQEMDGTP